MIQKLYIATLCLLFTGSITIKADTWMSNIVACTAPYVSTAAIGCLTLYTGHQSYTFQKDHPLKKDKKVGCLLKLPIGLSCISGISLITSIFAKNPPKYLSWSSCAAITSIMALGVHTYNSSKFKKNNAIPDKTPTSESETNPIEADVHPLNSTDESKPAVTSEKLIEKRNLTEEEKEDLHKQLETAIEEDQPVDVIERLIDQGADMNALYGNERRPLSLLTFVMINHNNKINNKEIIKMLISKGIDLEQEDDLQKQKPLHTTLSFNTPEIAKILLDAGANINSLDYHGWTPLMKAVDKENIAIINILINARAKIDGGSKYNTTNYQATFVEKASYTPLIKAIEKGNIDIVRMLLDAGADINGAYTKYGYSPLVIAIEEENIEIVTLLLDKGANIDLFSIYDIERKGCSEDNHSSFITPLMVATLINNTPIIQLLIDKGANPLLKNENEHSLPKMIKSLQKDSNYLDLHSLKYLKIKKDSRTSALTIVADWIAQCQRAPK